jgi:hypothetical protein
MVRRGSLRYGEVCQTAFRVVRVANTTRVCDHPGQSEPCLAWTIPGISISTKQAVSEFGVTIAAECCAPLRAEEASDAPAKPA